MVIIFETLTPKSIHVTLKGSCVYGYAVSVCRLRAAFLHTWYKAAVAVSIPPSLVLAVLINIRLSEQYGTTNFHKILYTELNILIGYKFGDLYLWIRITVEIRAINYLHSIGGFVLRLKNVQWTNASLLPTHQVLW